MAQPRSRRTLTPVTVLFADISGSTALYAERGDVAAFALTSQCLEIIERGVASSGGRLSKRLGDGLLAVFDHPEAALRTAVLTREALADPELTMCREGLKARFGIAAGPAVLSADDVFGDVVNVASRLIGLAGPEEILLSDGAAAGLPTAWRARARLIDRFALRNRRAALSVYEYIGAADDATVSVPALRTGSLTMEIVRGRSRHVVSSSHPRLTIGRDATHDICVDHRSVSRLHAELIVRGDKFVLIDRSTNGTYLHMDSGETLRLLREEVALSGRGRIIAGVESGASIRYRVRS